MENNNQNDTSKNSKTENSKKRKIYSLPDSSSPSSELSSFENTIEEKDSKIEEADSKKIKTSENSLSNFRKYFFL